MVDVSDKPKTSRSATAEGRVLIKPAHREAIDALPKGDALGIAQIAGIMGAKKCADLIPLCHTLPLTDVKVALKTEEEFIRIRATVKTVAETGVEMEAYTAVAVAGLTLIDMLKGVDPDLTLTNVRLVEKTGGKRDFSRA
jgi:cyclic pyranopterin phosphate synthase